MGPEVNLQLPQLSPHLGEDWPRAPALVGSPWMMPLTLPEPLPKSFPNASVDVICFARLHGTVSMKSRLNTPGTFRDLCRRMVETYSTHAKMVRS